VEVWPDQPASQTGSAAQTKKLQPALVFLPLSGQDQNILPVFGPTLATCLLLDLLPHTHRGGVELGVGLVSWRRVASLEGWGLE